MPRPPRSPNHRSDASTNYACLVPPNHGSVELDPGRVGRDASRIAEEVIAHLVGQADAEVTVTLEIHASLTKGAPEILVRIVTENSRALKFSTHGFEEA